MNAPIYPMLPAQARLERLPAEQSEFSRLSARDMLNIFIRHQKMILLIVVLITGTVALSQLFVEPLYLARTITKIDIAPTDSGRGAPISTAEREMRLETQTRLMGSQALAEQVVRDLDLQNSPQFTGRPAPRVPLTPRREKERVISAALKLKSLAEVKRQPRTQLVEVTVATPHPELSARIADQFPAAMQALENRSAQDDRNARVAALSTRAEEARSALTTAEKAVADFRSANRMLVGAGSAIDLNQINAMANEAASARGASAGQSVRASGIASAGIGGIGLAAENSPLLAQQQRQYDDLQRRKAELSVTYGPGYPEMQAIDAQLSELSGNIAAERSRVQGAVLSAAAANAAREAQLARSEAAGSGARASSLNAFLGAITAKAYRNTQGNVALAALERDAELARSQYLDLASRLRSTLGDTGLGGVSSTVLSNATVPTSPGNVSPLKSILAALIGSLTLGFLLAFVREMLDSRLRSSGQVSRRLGLPTLAMLPSVNSDLLTQPDANPVLHQPRSLFAEVTRALYNDIARRHDGAGAQVVAISSPLPGDGKSTVALSLAAAARSLGKRAILIDLDLRRHGALQQMQRESGGPDLLDYLTQRQPLSNLSEQLADTGPDGRTRLVGHTARMPTVLSVHEPVADPSRILSSAQLDDLIATLRRQYDFIVLNAPPVLAVRDAKNLSYIADEVVMVVKWGETTLEEASAAIGVLDLPPVGIVFNNVDYAEHARRRYNDPIQYVARAIDYYDDAGDLVRKPIWRWAPWGLRPVGQS